MYDDDVRGEPRCDRGTATLLEVRHPVNFGRRLLTRSRVFFSCADAHGFASFGGARAPIPLPFKKSEHLFAEPRWLPDIWEGSSVEKVDLSIMYDDEDDDGGDSRQLRTGNRPGVEGSELYTGVVRV